jgi:CubicO group peptidase (beta-lactamase class C family)
MKFESGTPLKRSIGVVVILCALVAVAAAGGSTDVFKYPESRAGEIARAYFEAFNSGDPEKLSEFESTYRAASALEKRSVEDRVTRLLQLHEQVGPIIPAEISAQQPNSLTFTAHSAKVDMWIRVTFSLEEEAPNKLVSVAIMPGAPPEAEKSYVEEWKDLADLLGQIRTRTGVPALAAATVKGGKLTDVAVVGERWVGSGQDVERDDSFHLGSVTKSITSTMIGALVQKELLDWNLTIGDLLGDMDMLDVYRGVTLEQLLQHRGGFPSYTNISDEEQARLDGFPGNPTRQREAFVAELLIQDPANTPGTEMLYSNAGYTVAAFMAERVSSRGWEELMRTQVFEPMDLETAGFGWPATPEHPNQPRGHYKEGDGFRPQRFGEYELPACIAPAGDVHCSIVDLARYASVHLEGLKGSNRIYNSETIQRLHAAPAATGDEMRYASGWAIVDTPEVGEVHTHSGSAGTFFVTVELYPEMNAAIVLAMNAGIEVGTGISQEITDLFKQRISK